MILLQLIGLFFFVFGLVRLVLVLNRWFQLQMEIVVPARAADCIGIVEIGAR